MDDQTTWKGHSFTLLVFTGIVVLCSIFFILGMLVGRAQGQRIASIAAVEAASRAETKTEPKDPKPNLTFFNSLQKDSKPALESSVPSLEAGVAPREVPKRVEPPPVPAPPPPPQNVVNYQIGAFRTQAEAEKLLGSVKKNGFKAFILSPPPGEKSPFYRVHVGPYADLMEGESAKKKLEAAGYRPILKN